MIPAHIPTTKSLRQIKSKLSTSSRLHPDPIVALGILKNSDGGSAIRDIGYDKFFIHFWSDLQLKIYKDHYAKTKSPTISIDATGGCCRKIKRHDNQLSNSIFLYEGIMEVDNKSFTVLSMLSEQHDNVSICLWLKRWLRNEVKPPKVTITDQSIALMSGIVQAFTQYDSLAKYLEVCFQLVQGKTNENIPKCYIRNDINHFVHLFTQWPPLKNSKYPRTKQLFSRAMGLLVLCTSMDEVKDTLNAIFTIISSRFDGLVLNSNNETPCSKSKRFLQSKITASNINEIFENEIHYDADIEHASINEKEIHNFDCAKSFKDWAKLISIECKKNVEDIEGEYDNAQYLPELEIFIINAMKLFPCWSAIMIPIFESDKITVSSARVESNFNQLKNRLFKNESMPIRVDGFIEKILTYYAGDHIMQLGSIINESSTENTSLENNNSIINDSFSQNEINCEESLIVSRSPSLNLEDVNILSLNTNVDGSLSDKILYKVSSSCNACMNGDFPTGAHNCIKCRKAVHLFGCSVPALGTEEGFGEVRLCLDCNKKESSVEIENLSFENWKGKGKDHNDSKKKRSVKSYLEKQPGFDHLDTNHKGSIIPIVFLKNGSTNKNKPISVPKSGKIILSNTCPADSLLTILATSAVDSTLYNTFLSSINGSETIDLVLNMIADKKTNQSVYKQRALLLLKHFSMNSKTLIGGLKLVNTMTTITAITQKLLKGFPSFIRKSKCLNKICSDKTDTQEQSTVISFNVFDGIINLQMEIYNFFLPSNDLCFVCSHQKNVTVELPQHLFIELIAVPQGKLSTYINNV